jgi:signal transduction histidine kinase
VPDHVPLGHQGGALTTPDPPADGESFWHRYRSGWHVLFGVITVPVVAVIATDGGVPPGRRTLALVALGGLVAWYAVAAPRAINHRDQRWALAYLAVAALALAGALSAHRVASALLFALTAQVFVMIRSWWLALPIIVLFYLEVAGAIVLRAGFDRDTLLSIGLTLGLPLVFALLLGAYIRGIIEQSGQRAGLIADLTRTRAELARERHAAGVRAERERLAAEIHDTLAQGFTSILMLAQACRSSLGPDPERAREQLDLLERTARENLAEARSLVAALAPPDLAGVALADALRRLAARHTRDTGTAVTVDVGPGAAEPRAEVVILRSVQEALANVRKHAGARSVHIELRPGPDVTVLTVTDDGRGFDPDQVTGGYGLAGLRARAAGLGGTAEVRSRPEAGTTVRVELPS